jgi:hypothetical protein
MKKGNKNRSNEIQVVKNRLKAGNKNRYNDIEISMKQRNKNKQ